MKYLPLISTLLLFGCQSESTIDSKKVEPNIQHESAYDSINALIKNSPNEATYYNYRAQLREADQEFELALADLNRAIGLDSLNDKWFLRKSNLLFELKRFKASKEVLDFAIFKIPGSVSLMLQKSKFYLILGDLQQCIDWANAALSFDIYNAQAYYLKGMAHKFEKDTLKAVTSFQTAVEQDINHYDAYIQLANLYALEKHKLAPFYYNNAIRIDSNSLESFYGIALYYQNIKQPNEAIKNYQKLLDIDSNYADAYYNMGYVNLFLVENIDTAAVLFKKAYAKNSNNFNALYMQGYSLEVKGNIKSAEKIYRQVLDKAPTHLLAAKGLNRTE